MHPAQFHIRVTGSVTSARAHAIIIAYASGNRASEPEGRGEATTTENVVATTSTSTMADVTRLAETFRASLEREARYYCIYTTCSSAV